MTDRKPLFTVARAYAAGSVCLRGTVRGTESYKRHQSVKAEVSADLTTAEARTLAAALVAAADAEDAKTAKKKAAEDRRKVWRDREIAAGRMRIASPREFFR